MKGQRYQEICTMIHEWRMLYPRLTAKDTLFTLYDDRMISGMELDVMMHDIDQEVRLIKIAEQRQKYANVR